jgi:hypothetical protein
MPVVVELIDSKANDLSFLELAGKPDVRHYRLSRE